MQEPLSYSLDFANGTVELTLTEQRFVVKTQGKGLLDKPKTIDIALTDLDKFCVVPTIKAQNIVGQGAGQEIVYDDAYDSEFIFSYRDNGKVQKKRLFVNGQDEDWQRLVEALATACPSASLLNLEPAEVEKLIGVISASKAMAYVFAFIIGVPLIIGAIVLLSKHH